MLVSWSGTSGKVYAVAGSNDSTPMNLGPRVQKVITNQQSCILPKHVKYVKVFEFDGPKTRGRTFGFTEAVGTHSNLQIQPSVNDVRMQWASNDPEATVVIARSKADQKLPEVITDGYIINSSMDKSAKMFIDSSVDSGAEYEYQIWLQKISGGIVRKSKPESRMVRIPGIIPDIAEFTAARQINDPQLVDISYRLPEGTKAKVVIYQIQGQPSAPLLGAIANDRSTPRAIAELDEPRLLAVLGDKVIATSVEEEGIVHLRGVPLPNMEVGSRTFIAVVMLGDFAKISGTSVIQQVGGVSEAEIIDRFDYQLLRVGIPAGANVIALWFANAGTDWNSVDQENPQRIVDIENEYRKFGGVVFTKPTTALPNADPLPLEPKRIFIRGASVFGGEYQYSPEFTSIDYPGRVVVRVEDVPMQKKQERKSLFRRDEPAAPGQRQIRFKVEAPATAPGPIALTKLKGPANEYPTSPRLQAQGIISLTPATYQNWLEYQTTGINLETITGPILLGAGESYRFLPLTDKSQQTTPIFVVEERISKEQDKLGTFVPTNKDFKVVLVGPKRSGKTTYVQALLNYLERQLAPIYSTLMKADPESPAAASRLDQLHDFIENGTLPKATRKASDFDESPAMSDENPRTPLRFLFEGGQAPFNSLEFYDVAGEDMDKAEDIALYEAELLGADLILFLLDPLQISPLRIALDGLVALPEEGIDPTIVLDSVAKLLANKPGRNPMQKVAIAVSKFDGLLAASDAKTNNPFQQSITPGMSVTRDPNSWTNKQFNEVDSNQVHQEIKSLLKKVQAMNAFLEGARSSFGVETRLFAVSALGHATFANKINSTGMTSYRVADPLLWMASSASVAPSNPVTR
jgi:hypothetical protein